jgi:hypothetical protein
VSGLGWGVFGPWPAATQLPLWPDPAPCPCMTTFTYISPTHPGHCCFVPHTQTCHPVEFAAWETERDRRNHERHKR